ncbi:hypothetical protein GCM10011445_14180 [Pseudocitrobacter faecalis]|nr:hypothetical protein GCM10011445_14180 [Pseudocitrobacter faecalis]
MQEGGKRENLLSIDDYAIGVNERSQRPCSVKDDEFKRGEA